MERARVTPLPSQEASGCRRDGTAQPALKPDSATLARLRRDIGRLEGEDLAFGGAGAPRTALGHAGADAVLQGGLPRGALHEVFCGGAQAATATGFAAALAWRVAARRPLLWIRQDFSERENGALSMSGFRELGLDPRAVVTVRAPDVAAALRITADALTCDALGAVVTEIWGETRHVDLAASRRLTLAARGSGATGLLLRIAAAPAPGAAETRWAVRAARSPAQIWGEQVWGAPLFDAQLLRNRHGPTGQWIMEWNCDECLFRDVSFPGARTAPHSQPVAAAPADRPHQAAGMALHQRAG